MPRKGPEMLYGFPLTLRLNIGLVARIDPVTGEFASVSAGLVPFFANSAAVAWKAQFLYVSNRYINGMPYNGSQILGYSINQADGALTPVFRSSTFSWFPPPASIQGLATTSDGRFLYGADFSGSIYGFRFHRATGFLTSIPGSPFASGANPPVGGRSQRQVPLRFGRRFSEWRFGFRDRFHRRSDSGARLSFSHPWVNDCPPTASHTELWTPAGSSTSPSAPRTISRHSPSIVGPAA